MAGKRYIGSTALAERYDRAPRTIARWVADPPSGFPTPIKINGRNLWDLDEIERYEEAETARQKTQPMPQMEAC